MTNTKEPYSTDKRALFYRQKRPVLQTKETHDTHNGAQLRRQQGPFQTKEPHDTHKRALFYGQKSLMTHKRDLFYRPKSPSLQTKEPCSTDKRALLHTQKSPILQTKEPYSIDKRDS